MRVHMKRAFSGDDPPRPPRRGGNARYLKPPLDVSFLREMDAVDKFYPYVVALRLSGSTGIPGLMGTYVLNREHTATGTPPAGSMTPLGTPGGPRVSRVWTLIGNSNAHLFRATDECFYVGSTEQMSSKVTVGWLKSRASSTTPFGLKWEYAVSPDWVPDPNLTVAAMDADELRALITKWAEYAASVDIEEAEEAEEAATAVVRLAEQVEPAVEKEKEYALNEVGVVKVSGVPGEYAFLNGIYRQNHPYVEAFGRVVLTHEGDDNLHLYRARDSVRALNGVSVRALNGGRFMFSDTVNMRAGTKTGFIASTAPSMTPFGLKWRMSPRWNIVPDVAVGTLS